MSPPSSKTRTALIVGASSGIGEALARALAQRGWRLGLAARRTDRMEAIAASLVPAPCIVRRVDLGAPDHGRADLAAMFDELGAVDLCVLSSGVGHFNRDLAWEPERETIDINVLGFAAAANVALAHFIARGEGHLVGVSSVAAQRGNGHAPAYPASKAFVSRYLDGLRANARARAPHVRVTEVAPGFVATDMMKADRPFWVATADEAAQSILRAIDRKAKHAYITPRWGLIATLLKLQPRPG